MNVKRLVPTWFAATITTFALGSVWHLLVMGDFYAVHSAAVARAEPDLVFIILGHVVLGLLMAIAYPIGFKGGSPVSEGFRFGALIGLIWILPWSLIIVGIWTVPFTMVAVDATWHVLEEGIAGIAVAYAHAKVGS